MQGHYTPDFAARFWARVDRSGACWPWMGARQSRGYGETWNGRVMLAHRVAFELTNGPIPDDLHICHTCDNPPCCNPSHLFAGTRSDNMQDMLSKGRGIKAGQHARGDRNGRRTHPERYANVRPAPMPGERNPKAKLTAEQVLEIRRLRSSGGVTQAELSRRYGVSQAKISQIVLGQVWKHLLP